MLSIINQYVYPLYIAFIIVLTLIFILKFIIPRFLISTKRESLDMLLGALRTVIKTELNIYDADIFKENGALNNATFQNYYEDITNHILNEDLSDEFYIKIRGYMNEDAVASIVCRIVKEYLADKIKE
jgi:hypothetical protein